jgi:glucose-1-phosphate adenylyltransferase
MDLLEESSGLDLWRWKIRTNLDDRNVGGYQPAVLLPTATVQGSIVSSGCKISGTVERSVLSPGVVVEEGAVVRDSIIFHESVIHKGAVLDQVISDKDVVVGADSRVGEGDASITNKTFPEHVCSGITILGKESQIGSRVSVGKNVLIYPGANVQDCRDVESGEIVK